MTTESIEKKIEDLSNKFSALQDLVLKMKVQTDLISRALVENNYLSEITDLAETNMGVFLDKRPHDCGLLTMCTTLLEKGNLKVLKVFTQKGAQPALKLLESYKKMAINSPLSKECPNDDCFKNAVNIYLTLETLIKSVKDKKDDQRKELYSNCEELTESDTSKEESVLISALSNEKRLNILKTLSKGNLYYNQLEESVGVKGGPFHFHLKKLIDAKFVEPRADKGPYSITGKGLKALKLLFDLSENF